MPRFLFLVCEGLELCVGATKLERKIPLSGPHVSQGSGHPIARTGPAFLLHGSLLHQVIEPALHDSRHVLIEQRPARFDFSAAVLS